MIHSITSLGNVQGNTNLIKSLEKISHLMYMGDIKLFGKNEKQNLIQTEKYTVKIQGWNLA